MFMGFGIPIILIERIDVQNFDLAVVIGDGAGVCRVADRFFIEASGIKGSVRNGIKFSLNRQ